LKGEDPLNFLHEEWKGEERRSFNLLPKKKRRKKKRGGEEIANYLYGGE